MTKLEDKSLRSNEIIDRNEGSKDESENEDSTYDS